MKYAVISDIHGDLIALEEALKEIEKHNVDKIICLGDIIGIGAWSNECAEKIISFKDKVIVIKGNHEDRVINGLPEYLHDNRIKVTEKERAHAKWIYSQLSEKTKDFILTLKDEMYIKDGNKTIAIMHYPTDENNNYRRFFYYPNMEQCAEYFEKYDADICLFGHTHVPFARHFNNKWIFNPGSLGLPEFRTYGTYGILDVSDEKIDYNEYDFKYDYNKVLEHMNELNYPQLDVMKRLFFGTKWL